VRRWRRIARKHGRYGNHNRNNNWNWQYFFEHYY
jgi:hypothetical protein